MKNTLCSQLDQSLHHYKTCFYFMQKGLQQTFRVAQHWRSAGYLANLVRKLDQMERQSVQVQLSRLQDSLDKLESEESASG